MNEWSKEKVSRYMKNASRFLWGLGPGNQEENYVWVRGLGFDVKRAAYSRVTATLISDYGIEAILGKIIVPEVQRRFPERSMVALRDFWLAGATPDISFLTLYGIDRTRATPLLEINNQFDYVERWGELAGVWFEEIERELLA